MISHAAAKFERFATELGEPYAFEPSFKLCASGLLDERFLMTYQRRSLGEEPWHLLESFGRDLEMPEAFQAELRSQLSSDGAVDIIHLGVEASPEGDVCKVYLENAAKVHEQLAGAQGLGRSVAIKNFPQCLLGSARDLLDNDQPELHIDDSFWREFHRNGFHRCVYRNECASQQCLGLNEAYTKKFGWEEDRLSPIPLSSDVKRPAAPVLDSRGDRRQLER